MKALLIGGTGLISTGIVKHLRARNAEVTMFNRGKRENTLPGDIKIISGDRSDPASLAQCNQQKFDAVIDMICFSPDQAKLTIDTFKGRCHQMIFCSTVCTYGVKVPSHVLIDETFPQEPISGYGKNKVACEKLFMQAHARGDFKVTIIRPSHTYGPGSPMIDNLESNSVAWDRIEKGLPVLCAGDGLGLWVSTHRDDCGKLFAHAAMNPKTFGQAYNATRDHIFTWNDYYHQAAKAMGRQVDLLYLPAHVITRADAQRFGLLKEITAFHGAYSSAKAKRDVPEFACEIDFAQGFAQTIEDLRRRKAWRNCDGDQTYEALVAKAKSL
jgi:nucleoside-diphosphate-sugar epimerase